MDHTVIQRYSFLVILGFFALLTVSILLPYLSPLIVGTILAVITRPLYRYALRLFRGREFISALITVIIVTVIVLTPLFFMVRQVALEATHAYQNLTADRGLSGTVSELIEESVKMVVPNAEINIRSLAASGVNWISGNIGNIFSNVTEIGIKTIVALFTLFYLLKDG